MYGFKAIKIILVVLSLLLTTGQQGECFNPDTDRQSISLKFDRLKYWMPLNEGNTKTFRYTGVSGTTYEYTKTVTGSEVVKGLETVKLMVTESNLNFGDKSRGCYRAYLPDISQGKTMLKEYISDDPYFGSYYMIYLPFDTVGRYGRIPIPGIKHSATGTIGIFKEDKTPLDSAVYIVETMFMGFEDVAVPAGTFKRCLKTWVRWTISYGKTVENNISVEAINWSAKGLDEVKSEIVGVIFANELDQFPYNTVMKGGVHELISATIDGVNYP